MRTLNDYVNHSHQANIKWWRDLETCMPIERNEKELVMLAVSELGEAMEGVRKDQMDDKLPNRKMEEVELVDFLIRMFDFCGGFNITLEHTKMEDLDDCPAHTYIDIKHFPSNKGAGLLVIAKSACNGSYAQAINDALVYGRKHNLDLQGAYEDKTAYNAMRADHKPENRRKEGGKKI